MNEYPSAEILAALRGLVGARDPAGREAIWRSVVLAQGNDDFPMVFDFALENELILPCESDAVPWNNPMDGSEMVWVPPGPFIVGSHKQRASCKGFSLARHPVTNAQFARFREETTYAPPAGHPYSDQFLAHWRKGAVPKALADHPVVFVSYVDALHYCAWAGLTLPTEWQWEKAARGPDGRPYPWGLNAPLARASSLAQVATKGTIAIGSFPRTRSPYGCEDLVGNVSEWCQTTTGDDPAAMPTPDPGALLAGGKAVVYAAVRGACYLRSRPPTMVSWHRRGLSRTRRNAWVGFRPACFLPCRPL